MAFVIATTNQYDEPQCPICHEPVEKAGAFCSVEHWERFHIIAYDMAEMYDMDYLDLEDQPWYHIEHG